jgi:hypothetical protein
MTEKEVKVRLKGFRQPCFKSPPGLLNSFYAIPFGYLAGEKQDKKKLLLQEQLS